jgi:hypothetical protein
MGKVAKIINAELRCITNSLTFQPVLAHRFSPSMLTSFIYTCVIPTISWVFKYSYDYFYIRAIPRWLTLECMILLVIINNYIISFIASCCIMMRGRFRYIHFVYIFSYSQTYIPPIILLSFFYNRRIPLFVFGHSVISVICMMASFEIDYSPRMKPYRCIIFVILFVYSAAYMSLFILFSEMPSVCYG